MSEASEQESDMSEASEQESDEECDEEWTSDIRALTDLLDTVPIVDAVCSESVRSRIEAIRLSFLEESYKILTHYFELRERIDELDEKLEATTREKSELERRNEKLEATARQVETLMRRDEEWKEIVRNKNAAFNLLSVVLGGGRGLYVLHFDPIDDDTTT
jgi:predicted nuclease with TOPRIM domain